jgi:hypothetical protein
VERRRKAHLRRPVVGHVLLDEASVETMGSVDVKIGKKRKKETNEVHSEALKSSKVVERAKLEPPRMLWV